MMPQNHSQSLFPISDTSTSQHYPVLQPRFKQTPQAVPPRNRYRAYNKRGDGGGFVEDCVEDDWGEEYGDTMEFDEFDEKILRESMEDRKGRAEKGLARLSFADSYPRPAYRASGEVAENVDAGRFAFVPPDLPESSSDAPFGNSSSPAFQASQRRAENEYSSRGQQHDSSHAHENETLYEIEPGPPRVIDSRRPKSRFLPTPSRSVPTVQPSVPVCQGIPLVLVSELPPRLRTVFPYPNFNAVQSKCFEAVYKSDHNFVLAAPTGSGKTVILELAICRAISTNNVDQYKIVYQAPTKALCSERQRDWEKKFTPVGLKCLELTGDSDAADLKAVQSANIIVTTPEKWDSITRKWKDHEKLMRLIKLFLIDEVHILKEDRGATLEAIVSRMKSIGTDVRFVALSATVPNFSDVATWLGKSSALPWEPAVHERFGEEFRPVRLRKHVCGYTSNNPNEFAFEKVLDANLPSVIKKYSERKPIMIFCNTRKSTVATAQKLANWWATSPPNDRMWSAPSATLSFRNKELRSCTASGVAFHHAGISPEDRIAVEEAYLKNIISVICCTSTLAVGVNLPCHMVIIKNTVTFVNGMGTQEYADLDIMQMLGRAGRPQFEDTAVAVIMTRQGKVAKYDKMVTGEEVLESTLHQNLIDHLNAEICLGMIKDLPSANRWLTSTFLYVRLGKNSAHYKMDGSVSGQAIEEQLNDICFRDVSLLRENGLMTGEEDFRSTEFGQAMARYYVHFKTMLVFMGLPRKAAISEILSAVAQASEFEAIRFRQGEKSLYKHINKSAFIRFPIQVDLALPPQKISLLIQSVLGAADIPWDGEFAKHKVQYISETTQVFRSLTRLIRCIIDCQIVLEDAVSINNALMLERSISARVWDDSPSQMKQIDKIGIVGVRKLANAGIRSIEELECTEPHKIESIIGRNPPFGLSVVEQLKKFPKLRISLSLQPNSISKTPEGVKVTVKADIGFINEKIPEFFNSKPVYVCMLAETSDGHKVHFARTSSRQLGRGQLITFTTLLTSPDLGINAYIMCDGIAGTQRCASVTPKVAPSMFPSRQPFSSPRPPNRPTSNMGRRRIENVTQTKKRHLSNEEYDDGGIDDDELMKVSSYDLDFDHIENFANPSDTLTRNNTAKNASSKDNGWVKPSGCTQDDEQEPKQLGNGKWACNHPCKNKQACKHLCCKEGMDKPPKKPAPKRTPSDEPSSRSTQHVQEKPTSKSIQTKLQVSPAKRSGSNSMAQLDLTQPAKRRKVENSKHAKFSKDLHKRDTSSSINSVIHTKPEYCYAEGGDYNLSFMKNSKDPNTSDYGDMDFEDLTCDPVQPEQSQLRQFNLDTSISSPKSSKDVTVNHDRRSDTFDDNDSLFEDVVNIADDSGGIHMDKDADMQDYGNFDDDFGFDLDDTPGFDISATMTAEDESSITLAQDGQSPPRTKVAMAPPRKARLPFLADTSSPKSGTSPMEPTGKGREQNHLERADGDAEMLEQRGSNRNRMDNRQDAKRDGETATKDEIQVKEESVPAGFREVDAWVYEEYGDVVEIVDE
ncbi:P-loop containing nucleoside triphosphate hydrolase protein [Periconia macrospinosa]|uniref:DNA 3'-5' helicase n=1 Tax=Periconia macrospinosa TaxID=97972 RepID=A0A2V1E4R3_9PLEO|nr:P-loop containing nucleoside triphosphate hydrolase protein [Periconia macrospinosa]